MALLAALLALPLVALAAFLAAPDADVRWQHQPSHFWLVLVTAGLNAALAYGTGVAARKRGDRRVHLVSLSFLAASGFLALHALATPGVLLDKPNLGFVIATPVGLALASALAALSALDTEPVQPKVLERGVLIAIAAWAIASLVLFPEVADSVVPERLSLSLVALSVVGVALYGFAVVRYLALYRERRSRLILGFAIAFVLLGEAMVALALGRDWQASWWEWHVLMLFAFCVIAVMAHREGSEERFGRLYLDREAHPVTVLFADLQGFTSYSEQHEPGEVSAMLDTLFQAAIPAIERHGGEVDRLVGDAVFATFGGDDHAQRAGRAALALQEETGALAVTRPEWPRFRAGLNTGRVSVGVLGTGSGRTYSAIGDTVNLGSRIEGLAPAGGVAISAETAQHLRGAETEPLDVVHVKGREQPVEVLLLLALATSGRACGSGAAPLRLRRMSVRGTDAHRANPRVARSRAVTRATGRACGSGLRAPRGRAPARRTPRTRPRTPTETAPSTRDSGAASRRRSAGTRPGARPRPRGSSARPSRSRGRSTCSRRASSAALPGSSCASPHAQL